MKTKSLKQVNYHGDMYRYHFIAKQMYTQDEPTPQTAQFSWIQQQKKTVSNDVTLLWKTTLPLTNFRKRVLVFKQMTYIIAKWTGDGFPSVIYISCDGFIGYMNSKNLRTNKVVALQLTQCQSMLDEAEQRTYDLKYSLSQPTSWDIPDVSTQLKFRVWVDDQITPIQLPLPNPISLNFEIRIQ